MATGTHLARADVTTWQAPSARLEGEDEVWLQIDGDPMRLALPLAIGLAPQRLGVLLPARRELALIDQQLSRPTRP